jgi:polysaccharide chain length determinant protein (PEP-CTERM system associated)
MLGHRSLNVEDYMGILKRRWWLIAIPGVILAIAGYATTYFIQPQFTSTALVLIEHQQIPTELVKPLISEDLDSRIASMKEQIKSRSSLEPIVKKYNLYASQNLSMDGRIALASNGIQIDPIHSEIAHSNGLPGFFISFTANDAHTAQMVCAEVLTLFVAQNVKARSETVDESTAFLRRALDGAKHTLDDQDAKLRDFEQRNAGKLPSDDNSNATLLTSLDSQLDAANAAIQTLEQNRTVMEGMLATQTTSTPTAAGPTALTPQAEETELDRLVAEEAELAGHYQPDYPDLKAKRRQIADLRSKMAKEASAPVAVTPVAPVTNRPESLAIQSLRASLRNNELSMKAKRSQQEEILKEIQTYKARIQSRPQIEEEYKQLTRDTASSQANYQTLLDKLTQANMSSDLERRQEGESFQVRDQPTLPESPFYPKKSVFAAGGLGAGIGLGLLISALLEYKDTALRSERDVWAFTQLPTLAVIAWSGDVAHAKPSRMARLKRPFSGKDTKDTLADATG